MTASSGFLTTHVLDTANGVPAQGVRIELYRLDGDRRCQLSNVRTNQDGRTDQPIIPKGPWRQAGMSCFSLLAITLRGIKKNQSMIFLM